MSDTKRIILTGATGSIGRRLFIALTLRGYEVIVFSRNPQTARATLPGAADYVRWTPTKGGSWAAAIDGAHGIIHLAGSPIADGLLGRRWSPAVKADIRDSRVVGTHGIVDAIAAASTRPQVLICASGVGYYGFHDYTPLNEDDHPGNDFLAQVCVAWEAEAARAEEFGVRVVRTRIGLVLDPESGVLPRDHAALQPAGRRPCAARQPVLLLDPPRRPDRHLYARP